MICTVGSTKGGVGKTTLAVNLVVGLTQYGQDVLLIDGDEQAHALAFTELRSNARSTAGYTAVKLQGAAIRTQLRMLAPRYDHVVIDVGGRDTGSLRAALTVADLILIPAAPRSFDLWGATSTSDLVREAREVNDELRALAVLNGADPTGNDNNEAIAALQDVDGIEVSEHRIVRRKAYPNAAAGGLSVLEYTDPKAQAEFRTLFHSLYPTLTERKQIA